jgi:hypothetical protein
MAPIKKERHVLSPGRLIVELRPSTGTLSLYMEHWKNHADKGKSKYSSKNLVPVPLRQRRPPRLLRVLLRRAWENDKLLNSRHTWLYSSKTSQTATMWFNVGSCVCTCNSFTNSLRRLYLQWKFPGSVSPHKWFLCILKFVGNETLCNTPALNETWT